MDRPELEYLVVRAARGQAVGWLALRATIEPHLHRMVGQPSFLGRVGQREADRRNIVDAVLIRLREYELVRLRAYLATRASNPKLGFLTWLRVIARRTAIDYVAGETDPRARESAHELLRYAAGALPFERRRALEMWGNGDSYERIARVLGMTDAIASERAVHEALDQLRREILDDGELHE